MATEKEFIKNPVTVEDLANNAEFQLANLTYYLSIKDYQSALIKANYLVDDLQNIMALKIGNELFK